jgi:hypothetical protein
MKVGTLTFEQALEKLTRTHSVYCDVLGEIVNIMEDDEGDFEVLPITDSSDVYLFLKTDNKTVDVMCTTNSNTSSQYLRLYDSEGIELDFFFLEIVPVLTMDEILHPVS